MFGKFKKINKILDKAKESGALIIDVRTAGEYMSGHIPGAKNCEVALIGKWSEDLKGENRPIYVYCQSGGRSAAAVRYLKKKGFCVEDYGGIMGYKGEREV